MPSMIFSGGQKRTHSDYEGGVESGFSSDSDTSSSMSQENDIFIAGYDEQNDAYHAIYSYTYDDGMGGAPASLEVIQRPDGTVDLFQKRKVAQFQNGKLVTYSKTSRLSDSHIERPDIQSLLQRIQEFKRTQ